MTQSTDPREPDPQEPHAGPADTPAPTWPPPPGAPEAAAGPPPYGQPPAYGQPPGYPQPPAYGPRSAYGQPPAYGHPPAYGQAPYGGPAPYGPGPYGPGPYGPAGMYGPPQRNASALGLSITAGILTVFCCSILTLPSLILGIVALSKQSTDPQGSARLARYGWIAFGIGLFISVLAIILFTALGAGGYFDEPGPYDGY